MTRALFKHIRWTFRVLTGQEGHPPLYSATCNVCGAKPDEELDDPSETEAWAMRHAAQTDDQGRHHTSFRMLQLADATVTPHPDDASRVGDGWALSIAP